MQQLSLFPTDIHSPPSGKAPRPQPHFEERSQLGTRQETLSTENLSRSRRLQAEDFYVGNFTRSEFKRALLRTNSDPTLLSVWLELCFAWFPERKDLCDYELKWSPRRQKQTLASVNLEKTRVFVARELNYPQHQKWLEPLLYHEMVHAYLRSEYHNQEFYRHEKRHPLIKEFDSWIDQGGWSTAVRSDRAKRAHAARNKLSV